MKSYCENCGKRLFKRSEEVYICSYEFTYCEECAREENFKCPHCEGRLERRPARILTEIKAIPINDVLGVIARNNYEYISNNLKISNGIS